jgi:anti-sigma regulatory factor (Ser/Thr protein kinase)
MGEQKFVLNLSSRMTELEKLNGFVEEIGEKLCLPAKCLFEISVALEEVFSNIVNYAFTDDKTHTVRIAVRLRKGRLSLSIEDDGQPFNPLVAAPPQLKRDLENCDIGGLGIHLIRRLVDDVRYTRRSNRNELTLIKHPQPRDSVSACPV